MYLNNKLKYELTIMGPDQEDTETVTDCERLQNYIYNILVKFMVKDSKSLVGIIKSLCVFY